MIRIGTRASALALAQARWVAERIGAETELVEVTTSGDRSENGDKSRWVAELERRLLDEVIDLAVHSAKDVPAELPDGLAVAAIPERADARDVLCGARSLGELPSGARLGTGSLRRTAQIRALRPDLELVPVRGNVDTRLRKLRQGEVDALVLAAAGLERLGRGEEAEGVLDELIPAAGQGALLIQGRTGGLAEESLAGVSDGEATDCVTVEREFVHALGASCDTPVGAWARPAGDTFELTVWAGMPDGSEWISDRVRGPVDGLAGRAAERMRAVGAAELLERAARAVGV